MLIRMLYCMWSLACILVLVRFGRALELHDPVPFPPLTRPAFGHPFSVSWTLDGTEVGDRLRLRAKKEDSEDSRWITLTNSVKLSDLKVTVQINADSSVSSLPSVAYILEANNAENTDIGYSSFGIALYSDTIVTSVGNAPSPPPQTATKATVNAGTTSEKPPSSQSPTLSADAKPTGTLLSPLPSSQQPTSTPIETSTGSNTSNSTIRSPPTPPSDTPSETPQPQRIVKRPPPIGPIIGGAVGGLSVFALLALCIFLRNRRQKSNMNAVPTPMPHEPHIVPVSKRERLQLEMTVAQCRREHLQSDLECIRHRSAHGPIATSATPAPVVVDVDGFENDAQRLRFEVGMMGERIMELEEALEEIEGDDRIPTHPPPDYTSVAEQ